jgi:hypothetical protein
MQSGFSIVRRILTWFTGACFAFSLRLCVRYGFSAFSVGFKVLAQHGINRLAAVEIIVSTIIVVKIVRVRIVTGAGIRQIIVLRRIR